MIVRIIVFFLCRSLFSLNMFEQGEEIQRNELISEIIIPDTENDENRAQEINLEQNLADAGIEAENENLRNIITSRRIVQENRSEVGTVEQILPEVSAMGDFNNDNAKNNEKTSENTNEKIVRIFRVNQGSNHGEVFGSRIFMGKGKMLGLPNEIWAEIASYLDLKDLANFRLVCHDTNDVVSFAGKLQDSWLHSNRFYEHLAYLRKLTGFIKISENLAVSHVDKKFVKIWYRSDDSSSYSLLETIDLSEAVKVGSSDRIKPLEGSNFYLCSYEHNDDTFGVSTDDEVGAYVFKLEEKGFTCAYVADEKLENLKINCSSADILSFALMINLGPEKVCCKEDMLLIFESLVEKYQPTSKKAQEVLLSLIIAAELNKEVADRKLLLSACQALHEVGEKRCSENKSIKGLLSDVTKEDFLDCNSKIKKQHNTCALL
ncbi:MAG: F-box protein [Myxococcales bacterium]|nr:F-box protein [Myxococcales bacterium]USN50875.1 MAG: F-box protein [Myxococcales bacterium]